MPLRIYNTATGTKDLFKPIVPGQVGIYVCGMTVYDAPHIGHTMAALHFDLVVRYLCYKGYRVNYVRNFTDIDDKIIQRAIADRRPWTVVAEENILRYQDDMHQMGMQKPDCEPRVTMHIPEIISAIEQLIQQQNAYAVDGDVYFRVRRCAWYGKLSGRDLDALITGGRIDVNESKEDPLDFALWKKSEMEGPGWESPWGKGRPGWHIECSVMSMKYLGSPFDIHGGGIDLLFPHHENELAQSLALSPNGFCHCWMHNGLVTIEGGKMSHSLKNFLTIQKLLERYHRETVRAFFLSGHYRHPLEFSFEAMDEAEKLLERYYETVLRLDRPRLGEGHEDAQGHGQQLKSLPDAKAAIDGLRQKFEEAMDDDFNAAAAVGHLFVAIRCLNRLLDERGERYSEGQRLIHSFLSVRKEIGSCLGVFDEPAPQFLEDLKDRRLKHRGLSKLEVEALVAERSRYRAERDFQRADESRQQLLAMGVMIEDSSSGTLWKVIPGGRKQGVPL